METRLNQQAAPAQTPHSLDPILNPQSVVVIGASDTAARIGGRPIHAMKDAYKGRLYAVNPTRDTVQGLPAYKSVRDLPEAVDCAIIAVPAKLAVQALQDCADMGVRSAVVFTSGFAEQNELGEAAQRDIAAIGKRSGMRILGPNCLGVFNLNQAWLGTFASTTNMVRVGAGPVGIVSQSGAYGAHLFIVSQQRGVGANYWVTTGNECDIDVAEVIEYYAQAPDVKVIVAYAEGMKDRDRAVRALAAARAAHKPVIFMKVGRTEIGAAAAASHTASLAGADAVYEALFRQYGVYRAETTEELLDVAYACQFGRYPAGRKVSIQSISGGVGVQMGDAAVKARLAVPELPAGTQARLKELIPFAGTRNPVDFTASALNDPELMYQNVSLTINEADFDSHAIYLAGVPSSPFLSESTLEIFQRLKNNYPDEVMIMSLLGGPEVAARYEAMGYPCFEDPSLAIRALGALTQLGETFERGEPAAPPALPADAQTPPRHPVSEFDATSLLASAGVPVAQARMSRSADEAVAAWQAMGKPVVMKIASPDITHKTEIGGVALGVDGEAEVRATYATLLDRARTARPDASIDGILVAEMVSGGVETVLGVVTDPVFGPAVMFGLGGVFVEVLGDVVFRLAPFGEDEARRMIDEIAGRAMLDGVRGQPPADIDALAAALSKLSVFAAAHADKIESIDINPFIVLPKGAVAVDALIVPASDYKD